MKVPTYDWTKHNKIIKKKFPVVYEVFTKKDAPSWEKMRLKFDEVKNREEKPKIYKS